LSGVSGKVELVSPLILQRKANQMANTTKVVAEATTSTTAKVAKATATKSANITEAVVVISTKTQRAVKKLALAHEAEKKAKARVAVARGVILDELSVDATTIGTDADGTRLVKVQVIPASDKVDGKALMEFLLKSHPEIHAEAMKHYFTPAGEPTLRVLAI
jgi:hypothetical protein